MPWHAAGQHPMARPGMLQNSMLPDNYSPKCHTSTTRLVLLNSTPCVISSLLVVAPQPPKPTTTIPYYTNCDLQGRPRLKHGDSRNGIQSFLQQQQQPQPPPLLVLAPASPANARCLITDSCLHWLACQLMGQPPTYQLPMTYQPTHAQQPAAQRSLTHPNQHLAAP
jgi:hypothetical protein